LRRNREKQVAHQGRQGSYRYASQGPWILWFVFVLTLQLQKAGCGGGSGINPTVDPTVSAVVSSDVHFNPFFDPSLFPALNAADASQWAGIFRTSSIATPSAWTTDTNYPLLVFTLSGIRQNLGASALVVFTGDILGHYLPQTFYQLYDPPNSQHPTAADVAAMRAFTEKTVAFFMQQVRSAVGNVPVMFALGNADSYTGLGPDSTYLSNTAELYYTQFLNGTADDQTFLNTFVSGGYYSAELSGTNLMVIGLNTFEFSPPNPYVSDASVAVAVELAWLDSTLFGPDQGKESVASDAYTSRS
jgi:sphingomyelin phosphodiesterase acid-like 3